MTTPLEALTAVIYQARWVDGIKNAEMVTDSKLAEAILAGGSWTPVTPEPIPKTQQEIADFANRWDARYDEWLARKN